MGQADRRSWRSCSVCGLADERALVEIVLPASPATAGANLPVVRTTLCGSHATMQQRMGAPARSEAELRAALLERRIQPDRRHDDDELGVALALAFASDRRGASGDRRR